MSHGASAADTGNKKVALLIGILALFLAFSEQGGNSSQAKSIAHNVEASNLWAFFQAKTIRGTIIRTVQELLELDVPDASAGKRSSAQKRIETWQSTLARYDSEPETQEGRKELMARAKAAEAKRDLYALKHEHYEVASGALQLAIVIASVSIITGVGGLVFVSMGLGLLGTGFMTIAAFFPNAVHLF